MLPYMEYVEIYGSPHELGAGQASLALQIFKLLDLLLRKLNLRHFPFHAVTFRLHSPQVRSWTLSLVVLCAQMPYSTTPRGLTVLVSSRLLL